MTIPHHSLPQKIALLSSQVSRDHQVLDIQAYATARREGEPLPLFQRINGKGQAVGAQRFLSLEDQEAIRSSCSSVEEVARAYRVDPLIVRDVRRPATQTSA